VRFLDDGLIKIGVASQDGEAAIREAGNLLLNEKLIEKRYIDAMIDGYKEHGPYFVLAPGIAIPHARPEDGVNEASVSLLQLREPVTFGHETNDPVRIVFGLGATSSDEHLGLLTKLTKLLNNRENVDALIHADSVDAVQQLLEKEVG